MKKHLLLLLSAAVFPFALQGFMERKRSFTIVDTKGKSYQVQTEGEFVSDVKMALEDQHGIPVRSQMLQHNYSALSDGSTLDNAGLLGGQTIMLLTKEQIRPAARPLNVRPKPQKAPQKTKRKRRFW